LILADEPTGNLDTETGKSIVETLINLAEQGTTLIIVTHDPRVVSLVRKHPLGKSIWIKDGQISEQPTYDLDCWDD
jgi:putative ABC transport system ATP-binding protein